MGSSTLGIARAALLSGALLLVGATAASAADQRASRLPVADGPPTKAAARAAAAAAASAPSHHGPTAGHLPPRTQEMELVGRLEPKAAFGDIVPGQIADLAVHKGFAYLNSWDSADCTRGGTHVVDIRNPAAPTEMGFIPAPADYYHGEGAHAISINTPAFQGDILAVNDETYGSNILGACSDPLDQTFGGFDLYDVSDPANPAPLVQGAGDNDRDAPARPPRGGELLPLGLRLAGRAAGLPGRHGQRRVHRHRHLRHHRSAQPGAHRRHRRWSRTSRRSWTARRPTAGWCFHHDVVVKRIGARMVMLSDYWDAGYLQLDVTDPANPTLITDTTFAGEDPLLPGSGLTPEGNAHQGEFSFDNQFLLTADEDFAPVPADEHDHRGAVRGLPAHPRRLGRRADRRGERARGRHRVRGRRLRHAAGSHRRRDHRARRARRRGAGRGRLRLPAQDRQHRGRRLRHGDHLQQHGGSAAALRGPDQHARGPGHDRHPGAVRAAAPTPCASSAPSTRAPTSAPERPRPRRATPTAPPAGTQGLEIEVASDHDGWGYAHLYDAATSEELDAFAIPESLDSRFAAGFGDLSIHEFATDPATNLAYASYYSGGVRVLRYSRANGLEQVGAWISPDAEGQGPGSNFWGIEQFTAANGERLIAGSDRDYGLVILRYTGPGAIGPGGVPAGPGPTGPSGAPNNRIRLRLGRYRNGRLTLIANVNGPGRLAAGLRANLPRIGAAKVTRLARSSKRVRRAGRTRLTLRLSLAKRRRLGRALSTRDRIRATLNVAWKPTGGTTRRVKRRLTIRG